jgi:hypothetical protein
MADPRDDLIRSVADEACKRVAKRAIAGLKKQRAQLSGDDSGLGTVWDELCVQVQEGESLFWDAYELTVKQFVREHLERLPQHERKAIWLQTDAGWDWLWDLNNPEEEGEKPAKVPFDDSDSVNYIYAEYLVPRAEEYSNARIEGYLEREQRGRFEMDREESPPNPAYDALAEKNRMLPDLDD